MSDTTQKNDLPEKTYTLSQIKNAYFSQFNASGEWFFSYLGSDEENLKETEQNWADFEEDLNAAAK